MAELNLKQVVELVSSDLTYNPSPEQRRAKQAFWARYANDPLVPVGSINLAAVQRLLNDSRLDRWWDMPGFREWFTNQEEFRERVEYLAHLALDSLEKILANEEEKGMAKVGAAKLLMEIARKMPPKHSNKQYLDRRVGEMDEKQLREYIEGNMRALSISPKNDKMEINK